MKGTALNRSTILTAVVLAALAVLTACSTPDLKANPFYKVGEEVAGEVTMTMPELRTIVSCADGLKQLQNGEGKARDHYETPETEDDAAAFTAGCDAKVKENLANRGSAKDS